MNCKKNRELAQNAVLWNRNYFLRFRFRLLKSYGSGSGSDFWKSYGSGSYFWKVTVLVSVRFLLHIYTIKMQIFLKKFVSFLHSKLFYKEKDYKYQQIYCKMWKKKMLNEGNHKQIILYSSSGSGSDFLTSYGSGSGSTRQKVTVSTVPVPVPVPQHWQNVLDSYCTEFLDVILGTALSVRCLF